MKLESREVDRVEGRSNEKKKTRNGTYSTGMTVSCNKRTCRWPRSGWMGMLLMDREILQLSLLFNS
jgi:hypothetical protein